MEQMHARTVEVKRVVWSTDADSALSEGLDTRGAVRVRGAKGVGVGDGAAERKERKERGEDC
jgi:hypothetical protein